MSDYSYLSKYYDSLTGNVDYDRRADFLVEKIKLQNGITVLDAGCGTGSMTKLLLERGFDLIGVDNSPEMLTIARTRMLFYCVKIFQTWTFMELFSV